MFPTQALKYIDLSLSLTFAFHSLRIKYQPSEGTMMIDLSTIQSLELIQNIQNAKSKDCLFGVMNETLTPMGSRLLRSNILQPSTQKDVLTQRYDAVYELSVKEDMFFQARLGQFTSTLSKEIADLIQLSSQSMMWRSSLPA
jgi:DNA mismatch repair protein MSH4